VKRAFVRLVCVGGVVGAAVVGAAVVVNAGPWRWRARGGVPDGPLGGPSRRRSGDGGLPATCLPSEFEHGEPGEVHGGGEQGEIG
jgi:hypothetical protein